MQVKWPHGKKFCFTFCDDPDSATVANTRPVYDFLARLGMRSTRLVWTMPAEGGGLNEGDTCADPAHVEWLRSLQQQGFELGLHHVAPGTSTRAYTEAGLARFRELFGSPPRVHTNHTGCRENLYWGSDRLSGERRWLYKLWMNGSRSDISRGHHAGDPLFWGDLCQEHVTYVRNFTCDSLNTLKFCPRMPYHDRRRPLVKYWFAASNASSSKYFRQNFTLPAVDRLVAEGGLCIAYIHFGFEFFAQGRLDPHFVRVMEHVAAHDGWFAPVSEVLDFLRGGGGIEKRTISSFDLARLEWRWLAGKFGKKAGI